LPDVQKINTEVGALDKKRVKNYSREDEFLLFLRQIGGFIYCRWTDSQPIKSITFFPQPLPKDNTPLPAGTPMIPFDSNYLNFGEHPFIVGWASDISRAWFTPLPQTSPHAFSAA
jgi:hypothetical protein